MSGAATTSAPERAAAELRRDGSSVRVAAGPGAPITSFSTQGHEWCAAGPWIDCAPACDACALPTFVTGAPRDAIPDGGLLALQEPAIEVRAGEMGGTIAATWAPSVYPLTWQRTIRLMPGGALHLEYAVSNAQSSPLPFVWTLQMDLEWRERMGIDLPSAARSRLFRSHGTGLPGAGHEFAWPALRDGGSLLDLSRPAQLGTRSAVGCYVETTRGRLSIHDGEHTLHVSSDGNAVTHARLWISNDADLTAAPPRQWWRRRSPQRTLTAGPSVGAPGSLSEAIGAWNAARWLEPGETLRWGIHCQPAPPAPAL